MMTGFVISVDPNTNKPTWAGISTGFKMEFSALDIAQSTFICPNYTGAVDDIVAFMPIEGMENIPIDDRCGKRTTFPEPCIEPTKAKGTALYYGVVTSINPQSFEITCSDPKTYLNNSYAETPVPEGKYTKPFEYIKDICKQYTTNEPMVVDYLIDMPWTGNIQYPNPQSVETRNIIDRLSELFRYHNIVMVVYADWLRQYDKQKGTWGQLLRAAFIQGESAGTLVIDKSSLISSPDVYVRPTMNGEPNGVNLVHVKKKEDGTFDGYEIFKRYITKDSNIVSNEYDENIIQPIKMTTHTYEDTQDESGAIVPTDLDKLAQQVLSVPKYAHEISFSISSKHPQAKDILKLGTKLNIIYKMKTYESVVNGFKMESYSDFIDVTCGNISSTLSSAIGTASGSGSVSINTSGGGSGEIHATESDIDGIIDNIFSYDPIV